MASLKKNIVSLVFVQICNYIIPLLQLPYLSRVLGVELFGVMAFSMMLIQFINVLTDYGFNLYIPQLIAEGRCSKKEVSILSSNLFVLKLILSVIGYLLFWVIFLLNSDYDYYHLYGFILSFAIFGNALFPLCIFQGAEILNVVSKIIIPVKLLAVFLIIFTVNSSADFLNIAVINMLQVIFITVISFYVLCKYEITVKFSLIKKEELILLLIKSFPFFLSRISVSLYTVGAGVFLGAFSNPIQVAYYNAAEQLYRAGQQVFMPLNQAFYPYMIRTKNYRLFIKVFIFSAVFVIIGAMMGWLWGSEILSIIFGLNFAQAKPVLDVFMMVIIVSVLSVLLGYPALSPIGLSKYSNYSVIMAGAVQVLLLLFLKLFSDNISSVNVVFSIFVCEILVFLYRIFVLFFKGWRSIKWKLYLN